MPEEAIRHHLELIQERIARACQRCGRAAREVTLVGVSKGQPVELLQAGWNAGLRVFGENKVQEAVAKSEQLPAGIDWHLIGPLQSNKVKPAVALFSTIHSVDRLKIALALNAEAARQGRRLPCFLEVNLGNEESKHGFAADDLAAEVRPLAELEHLEVLGLMAIPPWTQVAESSRPWFARLRRLRDELALQPAWQRWPGLLSMGMSGDFEVAIEEGATHVRVGTSLFGPRKKPVAA